MSLEIESIGCHSANSVEIFNEFENFYSFFITNILQVSERGSFAAHGFRHADSGSGTERSTEGGH